MITPIHVIWAVLTVIVVLATAIAGAFARDIRRAGGVRALHAELMEIARPAAPAPAPEPPQAPWYAPEVPHAAPARKRRLPKPWEPVVAPPVAAVPPWDVAAPSQGTGYTKWHAEHLRELLGRRPS